MLESVETTRCAKLPECSPQGKRYTPQGWHSATTKGMLAALRGTGYVA